jgi:ferritin-like metal-binding protein YciE
MAENNFFSLLESSLYQIYAVEKIMLHHLPKMAEAANSPHLKQLFKQHEDETQKQIYRLEDVFEKLNIPTEDDTLTENREIMNEVSALGTQVREGIINALHNERTYAEYEEDFKDMLLANSAQQIELFEIVSYEVIMKLLKKMKLHEVEDLLKTNLEEDKHVYHQLGAICKIEPLTIR